MDDIEYILAEQYPNQYVDPPNVIYIDKDAILEHLLFILIFASILIVEHERYLSKILSYMKYLCFLFLVMILQSCFSHIYNFDEQDKIWFSSYNEGDTILFSTNNSIDSFFIESKVLNNDKFPIIKTENEIGADYHASIILTGTFRHGKISIPVHISVNKGSRGDVSIQSSFGSRYYEDWDNIVDCNPVSGTRGDTLIINESNSDYGHDGSSECEFVYLMWGKKEGIMEYQLTDSTKYPSLSLK